MKSVIVVLLLVLSSIVSIGDSASCVSFDDIASSDSTNVSMTDFEIPCGDCNSADHHCTGGVCHSHGSCLHLCLSPSSTEIAKTSVEVRFPVTAFLYQSPITNGLIRPPIA